MIIADATMTKAVYNVNFGVFATMYTTNPSHNSPRMTNRNITDVFIAVTVVNIQRYE